MPMMQISQWIQLPEQAVAVILSTGFATQAIDKCWKSRPWRHQESRDLASQCSAEATPWGMRAHKCLDSRERELNSTVKNLILTNLSPQALYMSCGFCPFLEAAKWLSHHCAGPELTHREGGKAGFEINSHCHLCTPAQYCNQPKCKLLCYLYHAIKTAYECLKHFYGERELCRKVCSEKEKKEQQNRIE